MLISHNKVMYTLASGKTINKNVNRRARCVDLAPKCKKPKRNSIDMLVDMRLCFASLRNFRLGLVVAFTFSIEAPRLNFFLSHLGGLIKQISSSSSSSAGLRTVSGCVVFLSDFFPSFKVECYSICRTMCFRRLWGIAITTLCFD